MRPRCIPLPLEILFTLLLLLSSSQAQAQVNEETGDKPRSNGYLSSSPRLDAVRRFGYFSYSRNPGTGDIPPFDPLNGLQDVLLYQGSSSPPASTATATAAVDSAEANPDINLVLDEKSDSKTSTGTHGAIPMPTYRGDSLPSMLFGQFDPSPPNTTTTMTSTFDGNASSAMGMSMSTMARLHSDKVLWAGTSHVQVEKRWQGHGGGEQDEDEASRGGGRGEDGGGEDAGGYGHRSNSGSGAGEGSDGEHGGWGKHGGSAWSGSGKHGSDGDGGDEYGEEEGKSYSKSEESQGGSEWKNKSNREGEEHGSSWEDKDKYADAEGGGGGRSHGGVDEDSPDLRRGSDLQGQSKSRGRTSSDETGETGGNGEGDEDDQGGWHKSSSNFNSGSGSGSSDDGQWHGSKGRGASGSGDEDDGQWHRQASSSSSTSSSGQWHGGSPGGPRGASAWNSGDDDEASNREESSDSTSDPEDSSSSSSSSTDDSKVDSQRKNDMADEGYRSSAASASTSDLSQPPSSATENADGPDAAKGDCARLTSFYRAMSSSSSGGGGGWTNSKGWDSSDGEEGCCNWYGVTCDPTTRRVTGIDLRNNGLQAGSTGLGKDFFALDQLMRLDLSSNSLLSIPDHFLSLSHLTHLNLSSTSITGPIPVTLSSHLTMINLDLSRNAFDGEIQLSAPNLVSVDLSYNSLDGISLSGNGTGKLSKLLLGHNAIAGTLEDWSGVKSLTSIDISYNNTGPLFDISQLTNLKRFDARSNSLSGTIPSLPPSLTSLYLSSNNFSLLPSTSSSTPVPAPAGLVSCYILPQPLLSCPTPDQLAAAADNQDLISKCHLSSCSRLAAAATATSTSNSEGDQVMSLPTSTSDKSNQIPVYPLPGEQLGGPSNINVNSPISPYPVPAATGDVLPPPASQNPQAPNIVTPQGQGQGIRPRPGTANALGLSALSSTSKASHSHTLTFSLLIALIGSVLLGCRSL